MAQEELRNVVKKRMLEHRGAMPREECDSVREYKTMHEENFLSSWLREDTEGKAEEVEKMRKGPKKKRRRVEKGV